MNAAKYNIALTHSRACRETLNQHRKVCDACSYRQRVIRGARVHCELGLACVEECYRADQALFTAAVAA